MAEKKEKKNFQKSTMFGQGGLFFGLAILFEGVPVNGIFEALKSMDAGELILKLIIPAASVVAMWYDEDKNS